MSAGRDFEDADRRAAHAVVRASEEAVVSRIVYLGGLHPEGVDLSPHLRSRVEVGETFLDSTVPAAPHTTGALAHARVTRMVRRVRIGMLTMTPSSGVAVSSARRMVSGGRPRVASST